jgi:hypothetical protein
LGKYMTELLGNFKKTFRISQSWYIYWTRWNYSFWWMVVLDLFRMFLVNVK